MVISCIEGKASCNFGDYQGKEDSANGPPHRQCKEQFGLDDDACIFGGAYKEQENGSGMVVEWTSGQINLGPQLKTEVNATKDKFDKAEKESKEAAYSLKEKMENLIEGDFALDAANSLAFYKKERELTNFALEAAAAQKKATDKQKSARRPETGFSVPKIEACIKAGIDKMLKNGETERDALCTKRGQFELIGCDDEIQVLLDARIKMQGSAAEFAASEPPFKPYQPQRLSTANPAGQLWNFSY